MMKSRNFLIVFRAVFSFNEYIEVDFSSLFKENQFFLINLVFMHNITRLIIVVDNAKFRVSGKCFDKLQVMKDKIT